MKRSVLFPAAVCLALVSCEKKESEISVSGEPVRTEVSVTVDQTADGAPAAVVVEEKEFKIAEEEPSDLEPSPTPGQRLDHAIEKTEEGIGTAAEKTEEGLRKAAEKTGNFLQRAGEAIEKKASGE